MTMTKSAIAYAAYTNETRRLHDEYGKAVQEEFKPGMRVRWVHTYNRQREAVYREGDVVPRSGAAWAGTTTVPVQIKKGGPTHFIDGYALEILEPAKNAAKDGAA